MEVMVTKQRSDLQMNIPTLCKLDVILIVRDTKFFILFSSSLYDKWWIPAPKVPPNDLSYWLRLQKDSVNQVHKAVIAINSQVLSEMEIPESYIESLPWYNGRASRGDSIYKSTTKEHFDPDYFFTTMDMSSEHKFLESSRTRSKLRLLFGEEK
ncbi:hypothetical protein T459_33124 [Capsicum annuum]|uniref:PRONE domain-containing protein n=1 Tax=Capsicum annuum TaxID=4072 RepID=A0A2G2XZV0_CAPAN|nr:hypothetical protein T459_33124 [Capsicum annuum]